jgi:nitrite reductase/ring-hydroxylating ferredoxin subunit
MSKKKAAKGSASKAQPASKPTASRTSKHGTLVWIVAGAVVLAGIIGFAVLSGGGSKGTAGIDPGEAKYLGRLLPASYEEPKLDDIVVYTESTPMTDVTLKDAGTALELQVSDVTSKRNVYAEYTRADGKKIPLMAYLKPSGKLFVAISFCPPCEGEKQRIEADGTLTCESCGTKRTLETGVGISGACKLYPLDELPVTVKDGTIQIQKSLIDSWTPQPLDRKVG